MLSIIASWDWSAIITASAAVTTLVVISAQHGFNKQTENQRQKDDLCRRLENILEITVRYPYLENKKATDNLLNKMNDSDELYMRYIQYGNIICNFLYDVYEHYQGDKQKIEAFVAIESRINKHGRYWHYREEHGINNGYSQSFRLFINSYLTEECT